VIVETEERAYSNPYAVGAALGLVLLASFVITGRGLGASGAFSSAAAATVAAVAPERALATPFFASYLREPGGPWRGWLIYEISGVMIGGALSAWMAGRLRRESQRGPRISSRTRLLLAFAGGAVMGCGAVFARGCTSGQALTGGALLSVGSWIFVASAFAAGYIVAPLLRRAWV
jgi:uncharacterized membrane protein YedE/YeeE